MVSKVEIKKKEKNNDKTKSDDDKKKGIKPYLINLLKKLIYLLIFSFISFGILMSTQIKKNIKSRIPDIVTDFTAKITEPNNSNSHVNKEKTQREIEKLKKAYKETGPIIKWLSTTYNKTFKKDSDIYNEINSIIGSLFNISILDTKKTGNETNIKETPGQSIFSMILTSLYFFLSPILLLINPPISAAINYIAPFYYNFEYSNLLFNDFNVILGIIVYIITQFVNFFSDAFTAYTGFWGTFTTMIFEPYLYNAFFVAKKYIDPKNEDTKVILDLINILLDDDKENYNYWKTKAVPMIKKIAPVLVNLFLIYSAVSSRNYLPSQITIGIWVGIILINIPIILSLLF